MTKTDNNKYENAGFDVLLENLPAGIAVFNQNFKIWFINGVFNQMGVIYDFDDIPANGDYLSGSGFIRRCGVKDELALLADGHPFEKIIKRINALDGSKINVLLKGIPFFQEDKFTGGMILIEDIRITDKEEKLKPISSAEYANVLNNHHDLFFITDREGIILYAGGKYFKEFFKENPSGTELKISQTFPSAVEDIDNAVKRAINTTLTIHFTNKESEYIFKCAVEPVNHQRKKNSLLFFFLTDATEQSQADDFKEKEFEELKRYQVITETATDAVFAINTKGEIVFWNKASENLFGYSKSQIFGKFFGRILNFFDDEYFESVKLELLREGIWKSHFNVVNKKRGKEIVGARFTHLKDDKSTIIVLCSNETERYSIEKQLKQSEEKFRNIVTQTNEFICNISTENIIEYANPIFLETLGYTENELIGLDFRTLIDKNETDAASFNLSERNDSDSNVIEVPVLKKDGRRIYLLAKFSPVIDDEGIKYFNGFLTDITAVKETEKELLIFQRVFETSKDGIAIESGGKIHSANNALAEIFGFKSGAELEGKMFLDLVCDADIPAIEDHLNFLQKNIPSSERFEFTVKRDDNLKYFVDVSASSFASGNSILKVFSMRDVTERKRSQQALKDSEQRYRNLTENIDDFIYKFERSGNVSRPVFYTASVEKITGFSQVEFLSDSKLFFRIIHPDDLPFVKRKIRILMRNRIQLSEEFEFKIIHKYGNSVWVRNKVNVVRSPNGEVETIYGLISDITLRKKTEEELKNTSGNLVKLNETKDRFISIISHDLRTPFSSILGFTDLLLNDNELSDEEKNQYVRFIQDSSKTMLSLVNSLLDWTRLQTGRISFEPERMNASDLVESSIQSVTGAAMQKSISLINSLDENVFFYVDKNLIIQVFNNLISNAIKFTPKGGKIIVQCQPAETLRFVKFIVEDTGVGIKPENLSKLFKIDSKFTSQGTAGETGTGLGLSLVHEIVERHGGKIWVESEYGKGSKFIFTLPVTPANILLVDDSKTDRLLYSKILKSITPDYSVEMASDGKEALAKILHSPPALVITDHIMKEMHGYDLIVALQKSDLKVKPPIIVLSGELDRDSIKAYEEIGIEYIFHKPVNLTNFKSAVEKLLRKSLITL